ncbi:hypothetical protein [Paenibacillus ginsengarvi]|uniref:hypothetical protein n=1 Tax=Paenibacillus ginsengarvi TaxID=400777 RepID=UPI0013151471|nr:hypothetical protein [Paenibacillus ginsengarvi]
MNFQGLTVKELLELPILKDAKVVGGELGLGRFVRFIDIIEQAVKPTPSGVGI